MTALVDLQEALRVATSARVVGSGTRSRFLPSSGSAVLSTAGLEGIVQHDVADQVVEVWAGTRVMDLQDELARHGQCLPLVPGLSSMVSQLCGTIGGFLAMNLPHALSAQCGGPRDWTLGMTVVRTDGTLAKCGSKAVKNVAGYDAHRLFVGSRGSLVLFAKVVLRTFPIASLPKTQLVMHGEGEPLFVTRTLRTDFESTLGACRGLIASDAASCTLWSTEGPQLPRGAWLVGPEGMMMRAEQPTKFEEQAFALFDPNKKLARGWR